jgi:N-acetylglutamate synthase-like GNAT family acetyltransferase
VIRPAREDDVAAVESIVRQAYDVYVPRMGREPAPMTASYPRLVRAGQTWVAEEDGEIVGVLVVRPQGGALLLENVAVAPARQGRGIGRELIAFAERQARELGLAEVTLYTNEQMTENLLFYPALGFEETGRRVEDGYARVYFRKRLS